MKSFILFFALATIAITNVQGQFSDYRVETENGIPKLVFKSQKEKESAKVLKVTVPIGKVVILKLTETIHSDEVTVGQNVQLLVDMNVTVAGEVVIKSNAYAIGRVKKKKEKNSSTCKSTLTLEVTSVQTVDGQQLPLNGQEQTFASERPGLSVTIHAGKTITGFFKNEEIILIK